ncbi:zinc finger protein 252-like [Mugil cephalus]|uniref:zinc finger protein 252-like n=1 Tax=Mugil cephalus TaxID=48193 RepID=UPI001FB79E09|nr:zinc finger protein 252-like [Mugil cephalus]XP_047432237.1 zinc finger protein 252-like [Mugil cephalus]
MSGVAHVRGEVGGGAAAHLQCPHCGHFSSSHAHQLSHMAATHPALLDGMAVGRLGNILMYQGGARLFHCFDCFYTSREFSKLYKHIISKHCTDPRREEGAHGGEKAEDEEEEEEEAGEEVKEVKASVEREKSVLTFDGVGFRCLICGWKNKMKALSIKHVVQKHDIPKAYASQAIRREVQEEEEVVVVEEEEAGDKEEGRGKEEEAAAAALAVAAAATPAVGLSGEMLREEAEAMAKVVRFISNRFVCLICGWKTKLKGFAISHLVRFHDVERPYHCKDCPRTFFLPSRLQQHVRTSHRPGRYACPFCCFRSHFLGGFRRHCSRCNAREEGDGDGGDRRGGWVKEEEQEEHEEEGQERKEVRGARKRRRTRRAVEEEEENQEDQEDQED